MADVKKKAVWLLTRTQRAGAYANIALDALIRENEFSPHDRAQLNALYYGVLERQILLDAVIEKYSSKPIRQLDAEVQQILRLGIYMLLYMDSIPEHAAVSECVRIAKENAKKGKNPAGFINAVLRAFQRDHYAVPYPADPEARRSMEYGVPVWFLRSLTQNYGEEETEAFLTDALQSAPTYLRLNPLRCTPAEFEAACGERIEKIEGLPLAYRLIGGDLRHLPGYQEGHFYVQDLSAQLCALAVGAQPGEQILDLCAAPGGKTMTMAAMMNGTGRVVAFDRNPKRTELIRQNARRMGMENIETMDADALHFRPELVGADRVLCDVPCSGWGVIRRKPDVRLKPQGAALHLVRSQLSILEKGAQYVRPDGILVYSTCSVLPEENMQIVEKFLDGHPEFRFDPVSLPLLGQLETGAKTIFPRYFGGDGFFIARLRRIE